MSQDSRFLDSSRFLLVIREGKMNATGSTSTFYLICLFICLILIYPVFSHLGNTKLDTYIFFPCYILNFLVPKANSTIQGFFSPGQADLCGVCKGQCVRKHLLWPCVCLNTDRHNQCVQYNVPWVLQRDRCVCFMVKSITPGILPNM